MRALVKKNEVAQNREKRESFLNMDREQFIDNNPSRRNQSFKNPFSRDSYLKFRKEMMNI